MGLGDVAFDLAFLQLRSRSCPGHGGRQWVARVAAGAERARRHAGKKRERGKGGRRSGGRRGEGERGGRDGGSSGQGRGWRGEGERRQARRRTACGDDDEERGRNKSMADDSGGG
ncbi:hypothetical protein [Oryza sativa Japonica Group]|uniref:Uncharacterized protein n=1 Tax=Oryza sativa subsp. japonica TaxID=39947 RepID=Q5N9X5_ORYSJ|nr:hypothetical protein [Oryza sativa Japonica Group]